MGRGRDKDRGMGRGRDNVRTRSRTNRKGVSCKMSERPKTTFYLT